MRHVSHTEIVYRSLQFVFGKQISPYLAEPEVPPLLLDVFHEVRSNSSNRGIGYLKFLPIKREVGVIGNNSPSMEALEYLRPRGLLLLN